MMWCHIQHDVDATETAHGAERMSLLALLAADLKRSYPDVQIRTIAATPHEYGMFGYRPGQCRLYVSGEVA